MTSILPYWDQNIELEIVPWLPYGKDYSPVTVNSMLSPLLGNVAGLAFEMQSEFLLSEKFPKRQRRYHGQAEYYRPETEQRYRVWFYYGLHLFGEDRDIDDTADKGISGAEGGAHVMRDMELRCPCRRVQGVGAYQRGPLLR